MDGRRLGGSKVLPRSNDERYVPSYVHNFCCCRVERLQKSLAYGGNHVPSKVATTKCPARGRSVPLGHSIHTLRTSTLSRTTVSYRGKKDPPNNPQRFPTVSSSKPKPHVYS